MSVFFLGRIHSGVHLVESQLCDSTYRTVQRNGGTRNILSFIMEF